VSDQLDSTIGVISGTVYEVRLTISGHTSGDLEFRLSGPFTNDLVASSDGDYSFVGTHGGSQGLRIRSATTTTATVSNISVREINPLAVSIQMEGTMTYADTGNATELFFLRWDESVNERIQLYLDTITGGTGQVAFQQKKDANNDIVRSLSDTYSPGISVPFNIASRHGSTFINGAVDGTALTANTTPTALPDLSSTDMQIGSTFMGTIKLLRVWADDLTDEGIEEASSNA